MDRKEGRTAQGKAPVCRAPYWLSRLFANRSVCQHGFGQLCHINAAHAGFSLAQAKHPVLALADGLPYGKALIVRISGGGEAGQIPCHLPAQAPVGIGHGTPAVIQRAEPVPQVAAVPGSVVVARQAAVKEPGVGGAPALIGLQAAPALCHLVHDGRNDVLAGGAHQIGNGKLPACRSGVYCLRGDQTAVDDGRAGQSACFFLNRLPCGEQSGRLQRPESVGIRAACFLHHLFPEAKAFVCRYDAESGADPAAAAHHRAGYKPFCQRRKAELLDAHGSRALAHQSDPIGIAAKGRDVVMHPLQGAQLVV